MSQLSVSLLGCGWLGIALAHTLIERGCHVRGSTTHSSRVGLLSSLGVEPLLLRLDGESDSTLVADASVRAFFSVSTLVISLPPEIALGSEYHLAQIRTILDLVREIGVCKQIVYVSSTSVYGSRQGAVDETSVCTPDGESGRVLLEVEANLKEFARVSGVGVVVVRPGGLMGPGRHPGLFLAGRRSIANGSAPVNMIHQLDLAGLMASLIVEHQAPLGTLHVYNAVSPHHPLRSEFYPRAALAIGVEPPTFATESADGSASHSGDAKVVHAQKIVRVTGVLPRYADLYEAIGAV